MATHQELLAASLAELKKLQDAGRNVFASSDLSPTHRRRLQKSGFLREIMRGWYMVSRPEEMAGESTPWRANWREFVARYANGRFGEDWYLSPELSLLEQTASPLGARQVVIHSTRGHNNVAMTKSGWSLVDIHTKDPAPTEEIEIGNGLRLLSTAYALTQVSEQFFRTYKTAAQTALSLLPDISDLARVLLASGKTIVAGRLVGALRTLKREREANDLLEAMKAAGHKITVTNPFDSPPVIVDPAIKRSPYVYRVHEMWARMRETVIHEFPPVPGLPENTRAYLQDIDARYVADAYNSLSIEGYAVTTGLIEKVRSGNWNPDNEEDRKSRDALAAKGYSIAHDAVRKSIEKILAGKNPGEVLRDDHAGWNRALWTPSVTAGIIKPEDLAGYRNGPVFIKNADHVPPPREGVRDAMPALFDLLEKEEHAAVRAVLGHFVFVFIHPYMDGNGRLGRFVMNAMLASGGYPWTVVGVERRPQYMDALDDASSKGDIRPLAVFIAGEVSRQASAGIQPKRI